MERYDIVTAREYEANGETKTAWTKVGVMFKRDKGGFSISLDALPVTGKCFAFPPQDKSERGNQRSAAPQSHGAAVDDYSDDIPF